MANITVNIGGKDFPLTVEEHATAEVKDAAELINQKITHHQQQFKVDVKDALAMCALEFVTQHLQWQKQSAQWETAEKGIDHLLDRLQQS